MPRHYNRITLIGNTGKDPEMRYTPNGRAVTSCSLATNRTWKNSNGEKQEATEWHNLELFGASAENFKQYVTKGSLIWAEGRVQTDKWQGEDGKTKYFTKVIVDNFGILSSKENGNFSEAQEVTEEETIQFS